MIHPDLFFYVLFTVLASETVTGTATDVRLLNSVTNVNLKPYEGPIQVFEDGEWGLLQRHAIDTITAKTICKILGYGYIGFRVERFAYTGLYTLSRLTCSGNETSISECVQEHGAFQGGADAAGVHCFEHVFKDVRLSGGTTANKGSVQVKMDGRWGLVCSHDQSSGTMPSPDVFTAICRSLGYMTYDLSQSFQGYTYDGVELSWLDIVYFSCNGSETHFNQCTFLDVTQYQPRCYVNLVIGCMTPLSEYCSSDDICAGVPNAICKDNICVCKNGYGPDGQFTCSVYIFRLYTFTEHLNEGLVEVSHNGSWNLISEPFETFSETTSKFLCRSFGFGYVGFSTWQIYDSRIGYTGGAGYRLPKCNGSETDINECFDVNWSHTGLSDGLPVTRLHCYDSRINDIRLRGGAVPHEGIVEVRIEEKWGTVCYLTTSTEDEVCRMLGYINSSSDYPSYSVNDTNGIWLTGLDCNSTATDINDCSFELGVTFLPRCILGGCCHYEDELALSCTPMRLVDGATPNSGRIEAGFYGKLHTICADEFDMAAANVTCKVLGYDEMTVVARLLPEVGAGEIGMLNASVKCNGSENSLEQCIISGIEDFRCPSGKTAGISCLTPLGSACTNDDICAELPNAHCMQYRCTCQEGFVQNGDMNCTAKYTFRLVRVNDEDAEGLVEMKLNNTWGLVTSEYSSFSDATAKVICATLGYGYNGFSTASFPDLNVSYTGFFWNKLIECTGTETHATACVTGDWVAGYQLAWSYVTRLHCYEYLVTDLRLQGGVLPNEGRLEVQVHGRWGSVCLNTRAYPNVDIRDDICRFLGYVTDSYSNPSMTNVNVDTDDEVWMSHPNCNATSMDINDCTVTKGVLDACSGHGYDLELKCDPIRLRDGATPNAGQIEAGIHGQLISFCIDGFDINAANVTCNVLGYYGVKRLLTSDNNGTDIYNGEITCSGTETSLESCDLLDGGMINCKQSEVAYVECQGAAKIIPLNNKSYEGVFVTYYMHKWRYIGTDVSEVTVKTICNILGFGYTGYAVTLYDAIDGGTDILEFLACKGNESDVAECASGIYQRLSCHRCPPVTFGTVKLYCSDYRIDGIRFVDSEFSTEGVIHVLVDGDWGHICATDWDTTATNIACKTRGFKSGVGFNSVEIANASIQIGHVKCQGSESNLNQCTFHKKGYYEHIQPCSNTLAISCTNECDVAWYGRGCLTLCTCNDRNSETSVNGRACDVVTGECTCKRAWSGATCDDDVNECLNTHICQEANTQCNNTVGGYACICIQDYEINDNGSCVLVGNKTDTAMLVIIVSSGVAALLFIIVVATICFCTFSRRHTQGDLNDTTKTLPDTRIVNSNVLATSIRSTASEYDTINDEPVRDVLDVNALRVARHKKDGYLGINVVHRDNQNENSHTYTGLKTDQNDGYLDFNAKEHYYTGLETEQNRRYLHQNPASRKLAENYDYPYVGNKNKTKPPLHDYPNVNVMRTQLPAVHLESEDIRSESPANRVDMRDHYQGLTDRRLGENMYERKLDEDGYMKPIVSDK